MKLVCTDTYVKKLNTHVDYINMYRLRKKMENVQIKSFARIKPGKSIFIGKSIVCHLCFHCTMLQSDILLLKD